jgi:hypothetical protein
MDERLRICLWMVGGGGLGAILGGTFGALTGVLHAQSGGAAGTGFGRRVADAFARTAEEEVSPARRAAMSGAADGFLFLGLLGLVAGALLGASGRSADELLLPALGGAMVLVGGAVFFGVLALAMTRIGVWAVIDVFACGLLGSLLAGILLGADRCLLGTLPGLLIGLIFSFLRGRYAPTFRPPQVGKPVARFRSDAETDITGPPHHRPGRDAFRQPDASDEQ